MHKIAPITRSAALAECNVTVADWQCMTYNTYAVSLPSKASETVPRHSVQLLNPYHVKGTTQFKKEIKINEELTNNAVHAMHKVTLALQQFTILKVKPTR